MSRFFPQAAYEEDQKYGYTILTTHVLTRGLQTGSLLGTSIGASVYLYRRARSLPSSNFTTALLRSTGVGAVTGTALLGVALVARMWGREQIEWQDRSWRLLANKGQVECDDWTYSGMGVGLLGGLSQRGLGWRGIAGGVGVGSVMGMVGYMGWRYGVKGGKFDEEKL